MARVGKVSFAWTSAVPEKSWRKRWEESFEVGNGDFELLSKRMILDSSYLINKVYFSNCIFHHHEGCKKHREPLKTPLRYPLKSPPKPVFYPLKAPLDPKTWNFFDKFLIDNQHIVRNKKNIWKNCLSVMKKVVLLHPLSEGTRGETRGVTGAQVLWKSEASTRPAPLGSGARQGTFNKGTPKRTSRRNPRYRETIWVRQ